MEKDEFDGLREQLESFTWPRVYMFKFIVPNAAESLDKVYALFNSEVAEVSHRESKSGKFISVTGKEMMLTSESVIERYKQARGIPGLLSL